MKKRILSYLLVTVLLLVSLLGCAKTEDSKETGAETSTSTTTKEDTSEDTSESNASDEVVELNYWTWFPTVEQLSETVAAFEAENPNIKIKMTVMDSATYQQKIPLALSTGEVIDLVGVQPSEFATSIQDYLADLDELMPTAVGSDWSEGYSTSTLDKGKYLTGDTLKFITILNSGSCVGFYNAELLADIGKEVPMTIEEYKDVAEALYAKYPDKMAGVFGGLESWIVDEMMLTVLGQQGDYYNQWVYDGAAMDTPEYIDAINGLKQFFDEGIFTQDVMDLDYGSATEAFTTGNALVYYMGTWEAPLLSSKLREQNGIDLKDVGCMALPVVKEGGVPTIRSYMDCGIGIVKESKKQEAAAKFLAFCSTGDGVSILAKQFAGTPGMETFAMDESLLTSDVAREGWDTMLKLMNTATADRKNESSFSGAVEGPTVQTVLLGGMTAEDAVEKMQKEWTSGNY